jgi:hypothetical protein
VRRLQRGRGDEYALLIARRDYAARIEYVGTFAVIKALIGRHERGKETAESVLDEIRKTIAEHEVKSAAAEAKFEQALDKLCEDVPDGAA